jgi:hypothetical protein
VAFDEAMAERVRRVAVDIDGDVTERRMFGGLAFMVDGHMFVGVVGEELMLRLGEEEADRALDRDHVRPMDFTGRTMKGFVFIGADGLRGRALRTWVLRAATFAQSLPPK